MALNGLVLAPYNAVLGIASTNVPAYSNTNDDIFSVERHYFHGIFLGAKWQCVEYARRWLLFRKSCLFENIGCAADIWTELTSVERVTDGKHFPLKNHPNGSPEFPKIDSFLIYPRCAEQPVGHIAVICDVGPDYIRIAEQNNKFHYWVDNYARQLEVKYKDGLYFIEDEDPIAGWMEIEDNNELKPLDQLDIDAIDSRYQQPQPSGKMERCLIPYKSDNSKGPWLNKDDPAENFFMKHFGEDLQRVKNSLDHLPYYKINADLLVNIGTVSNELHRMFLEATNRVIQDDQLLTRFGIPNIFWNRIRQSWTNDQNLTMTGRFDLAFNDQKLKVFEYNADSASALFECAIIQRKWAEAVDLPSKFMTGTRLHSILVNNWKKMKISTRIHLLIDNDHDEMLTALYMQRVMKEAGIESKICVMTDEFYWKDETIIDSDSQMVKFVWKLWMWETIFQDYIDASKERNLDGWKPPNGEHPRISDILLHDQIKVVEPLWKVITSNKALLPVVWSMYPNHPNLLRSEWTLTNELKETSFVKKPLVGRCGQNITLYNASDNSVIDETTGQFSSRDCIYQQLFPLKNYDGYYAILGSWIVHGNFAGFCIREDQKLITDANSPVTACCIVWD